MELKELSHFIDVVRYGGYSRAAENIYVSQPTLSKSIKKLELTLNVELFERSTRKLILTDAGSIVYGQAQEILGKADELTMLLNDLALVPKGKIHFGIPPLIGALFFPEIARSFVGFNPKIKLELVEHGAKRIESLIDEGKVDIGIVVLPTAKEKFNIFPFKKEMFKVFLHTDHPLAQSDKLTLADLKNEDFILFNPEFALHDLIIRHCQNAGFEPNIAYESSQWDLITELVNNELGITILPQSVYSKMNKNKVKMIPLENPPIWELNIITKKNSYHGFAVKELLNFLTKDYRVKNG
ncbi:MAG TPA: LysR family transcriptional regulator [Pseudogracilibacillus sp.]|nr:LysR family transcriptional regulator [Pseudogracilibacillus sp.]